MMRQLWLAVLLALVASAAGNNAGGNSDNNDTNNGNGNQDKTTTIATEAPKVVLDCAGPAGKGLDLVLHDFQDTDPCKIWSWNEVLAKLAPVMIKTPASGYTATAYDHTDKDLKTPLTGFAPQPAEYILTVTVSAEGETQTCTSVNVRNKCRAKDIDLVCKESTVTLKSSNCADKRTADQLAYLVAVNDNSGAAVTWDTTEFTFKHPWEALSTTTHVTVTATPAPGTELNYNQAKCGFNVVTECIPPVKVDCLQASLAYETDNCAQVINADAALTSSVAKVTDASGSTLSWSQPTFTFKHPLQGGLIPTVVNAVVTANPPPQLAANMIPSKCYVSVSTHCTPPVAVSCKPLVELDQCVTASWSSLSAVTVSDPPNGAAITTDGVSIVASVSADSTTFPPQKVETNWPAPVPVTVTVTASALGYKTSTCSVTVQNYCVVPDAQCPPTLAVATTEQPSTCEGQPAATIAPTTDVAADGAKLWPGMKANWGMKWKTPAADHHLKIHKNKVVSNVVRGEVTSLDCVSEVVLTDNIPPVVTCNTPTSVLPGLAVINPTVKNTVYTAGVTDNCQAVVSPAVTFEYKCCKTYKGQAVCDPKFAQVVHGCKVVVNGASLTIVEPGGVDSLITWTVTAVDVDGNPGKASCGVYVGTPSTSNTDTAAGTLPGTTSKPKLRRMLN